MYDDGRIALDGEGVTLRRYYFPTGASKHILLATRARAR